MVKTAEMIVQFIIQCASYDRQKKK